MPSYPGSVWAPSAKTSGQAIDAAHVNDLQDEVVAIEGGLRNGTAPLNSSNSTVANLSVTGGSTFGVLGAGASTLASLQVTGASTSGSLTLEDAAPATPVATTLYADNLCKAWGYIDNTGGAPVIGADVNVASVTDNGTGDWTVVYATGLPATYAVAVTCVHASTGYFATHAVPSSGSIRVRMWNAAGAAGDVGVSVICLG